MFLFVDKPTGITSHDVIDRLRKVTGIRRIGHAGTLDPNATGLLIVGITRQSTKQLGTLTTDTNKVYEAEVCLGEERDTDDVEGTILHQAKDDNEGKEVVPALSIVVKILQSFEGEQDQMPPVYSAIKLKGKKAYELAREGKSLVLSSRKVVVHSIKLLEYKYPKIRFEASVSSGTYIRSIARDIGRDLNTYGFLNNLRRTKIGKYSVEESTPLGEITSDNWRELAVEL